MSAKYMELPSLFLSAHLDDRSKIQDLSRCLCLEAMSQAGSIPRVPTTVAVLHKDFFAPASHYF